MSATRRTRRWLFLAAICAVFSLHSPAALAAQVASVAIRATGCVEPTGSKTEQLGAGVVVVDPTNANARVVLTALHVVYRCDLLEVRPVRCGNGGLLPSIKLVGTAVRASAGYDLAALELTATESATLLAGVVPSVVNAGAETDPAESESVSINATSLSTNCAVGSAKISGTTSVKERVAYLRWLHPRQTEALTRGTLLDSVELLSYQGGNGEGASGGAVTRHDSNVVLAIHQSGAAPIDLGWGILVADVDWQNFVMAHLGGRAWPKFRTPNGGQSADLLEGDPDGQFRTMRRATWGIVLSYEHPFEFNEREIGRVVPQLARGAWPWTPTGDLALGLRVALGPEVGSLRRTFADPSGNPLESESVTYWGVQSELAVELWLRRLSAPGIALGVVGRLGIVGFKEPDEGLAPALVPAGLARLRVVLPTDDPATGLGLQLAGGYEYPFPHAFRYSPVSVIASEDKRQWAALFSAGASYEY